MAHDFCAGFLKSSTVMRRRWNARDPLRSQRLADCRHTRALDAIGPEIAEFAESPWKITTIVCLVGENIRAARKLPARTFAACFFEHPELFIEHPIRTPDGLARGVAVNISLVVAAADRRARRGRIAPPGVLLVKLAIVGYGKMGRLVEQVAPEYGFTVHARIDVADDLRQAAGRMLLSSLRSLRRWLGTSKLYRLWAYGGDRYHRLVRSTDRISAVVEKNNSGLVWSPNFSIGVNVFFRVVREGRASCLISEPQYGAWAWEIHHHTKKDAPSGTLLKLVEEMKADGYSHAIDTSSSPRGRASGNA